MQPWQPIDHIPVIPEGEIAVFRCALAGALVEVASLRTLLAANELERLDRFQSEPAAVAFLQTRALVRRVLATTTRGGFVLAPEIVPIHCQPAFRIHVYI